MDIQMLMVFFQEKTLFGSYWILIFELILNNGKQNTFQNTYLKSGIETVLKFNGYGFGF